jgi:hypothetical protein
VFNLHPTASTSRVVVGAACNSLPDDCRALTTLTTRMILCTGPPCNLKGTGCPGPCRRSRHMPGSPHQWTSQCSTCSSSGCLLLRRRSQSRGRLRGWGGTAQGAGGESSKQSSSTTPRIAAPCQQPSAGVSCHALKHLGSLFNSPDPPAGIEPPSRPQLQPLSRPQLQQT